MVKRNTGRLAAAIAVTGAALLASGCASAETSAEASKSEEAAGARLAVATESGIAVLDAAGLKLVDELPVSESVRLSDAGDGAHLVARTGEGFQLLDTRVPELTDVVFTAEKPGHVVVHGDQLALFDDATGSTRVIDTAKLSDRPEKGGLPLHVSYTGANAHHGVSVPLGDGTMLTTVGTEESRSGVALVEQHDDHWHDVVTSDECPGVHGEAVAKGEAVVFGCKDGVLVFRDGAFTKLAAPAPGGASGSVYATEASAIAVADFATDPESHSIMIPALTLIDTAAGTQRVVELPEESRVTFRGIARDDDGLAYLLSADGSLRVLNPETGEFDAEYPVITAWDEPGDWMEPMPGLVVHDGTAFVTDPATKSVHAVDLATGKILESTKLDAVPGEIALAAAHR